MTEIARTNPPAHVRQAMDEAERAQMERLREFARWLVMLDNPGSTARRAVTLNAIIDQARTALGQESHSAR